MHQLALLVAMTATTGLFGGRQATCSGGSCGGYYSYAPSYCQGGSCGTVAYGQHAQSYASHYYAPAQQPAAAAAPVAAAAPAPAAAPAAAAPAVAYRPAYTPYYYN